MMDMKEFISLPLFPLLCGFGCSELLASLCPFARIHPLLLAKILCHPHVQVLFLSLSQSLTFCTKQVFLSVRDFWRFIYYFCAALDAVVDVLLLLVCEQPTIWSRSFNLKCSNRCYPFCCYFSSLAECSNMIIVTCLWWFHYK